ncbi:DUF6660 family protein [Algibacter miyuki]|uniref:DUF6660 family protein n=1 Tax=Algibacter miyuki TaxID=1306933 RepID=A0ABV5H0I2_9FLAO|nr:DUF6660 family protein [Algibacter miyuki]MDN3667356.1 hypothetical protein [Algibacter miyuki]
MKFLAFILSIYIFALNLTACDDSVVVNDDVKTEISQNLNHDSQHQDADLCSPFCNCQCCHINVTNLKTATIKFEMAFISTQDFFYLNQLEKDFNTSILQPPRA